VARRPDLALADAAGRPDARRPVPDPDVDDRIVTPGGRLPFETPRELATDEVRATVADHASAARNALRAGFDGAELHAANGYLIDQFLHDAAHRRSDVYGGPVDNRLRFLLEVVDAVAGVVGGARLGVRLSPSSTWMECDDSDKRGLYEAVVSGLGTRDLAYLHLVEPTIAGSTSIEAGADAIPSSVFRKLFPGPVILAGDHTFESATRAVESGVADLVAFGRAFISNPDLPQRFATGAPLATSDRRTYYSGGDEGYTDYPALPPT